MTRPFRSLPALTALVTALAVPALAVPAAETSAARSTGGQRVMLVQKHRYGAEKGTFVLHALAPGSIRRDSGRFKLVVTEKPILVRDGQWAAVYVVEETLTGRHGSLVISWRVEFVGAGDGITVGTGTWSLVRGRGSYAGTTGGGRVAAVVATPDGFTSAQFEGLLSGPRRPSA